MDIEIAARKVGLKESDGERHRDIFSRLVAADESESVADAKLSDREVIGNTFVMLLAGHGTSNVPQRLVSLLIVVLNLRYNGEQP
jgi:cytochrome P450